MSASRELGPEWVLSASFSSSGNSRVEITELTEAARRLWPGVQAHARKEQAEARFDDALALATEVWEGVLRSVAKTLERSNGKCRQIENLDAYLFGAFHHRFNRALRKDRRRREVLEQMPSNGDLGRLRRAHDSEVQRAIEQSIQLRQAFERNLATIVGAKRRSAAMDILKHPAFAAVYAHALERCIDRVPRGNVPHAGMTKTRVTSLEFRYEFVNFLLERLRICTN
jgi:DNA-directed RNA polymerase specialized sigma24 family protein